MIKQLKIRNVGPASVMELDCGNRLNLLTGDNGLGKSFLLDIIWWSLTRKWPAEVNPRLPAGLMAKPHGKGEASIEFTFTAKSKPVSYRSIFDRKAQAWTGKAGRPSNPGLILYAQVDGSFSVWDPARNYWRKKNNIDIQDRPPAYVFSPREVWDGLHDDSRGLLCNGLIADWAGWKKENGDTFKILCAVLEKLSPSADEKITPGDLTRISLDDPRDIPTLKMPYGQSVPVLHVSAGMRRILALAYLLVWSWDEHVTASAILDQDTASQIIFLIDEIEAHLHPKWQRLVIRSLLDVVNSLAEHAEVQLIAATHSPLVMASAEPIFDHEKDAWFDLDLSPANDGQAPCVTLHKKPLLRRGDASNWLTSEAFDLASAGSAEAEQVLGRAAIALSDESFNAAQARQLDAELRTVLGEIDPFWMRWRFVAEKKGWL